MKLFVPFILRSQGSYDVESIDTETLGYHTIGVSNISEKQGVTATNTKTLVDDYPQLLAGQETKVPKPHHCPFLH